MVDDDRESCKGCPPRYSKPSDYYYKCQPLRSGCMVDGTPSSQILVLKGSAEVSELKKVGGNKASSAVIRIPGLRDICTDQNRQCHSQSLWQQAGGTRSGSLNKIASKIFL